MRTGRTAYSATVAPRICDQCETVAHCQAHGCIPVEPAPDHTRLLRVLHRVLLRIGRLVTPRGTAR